MAKRTKQNRTCPSCGESYYRINVSQAWTARNPGRRDGWYKEKSKACTKCVDVGTARRMIAIATVGFACNQNGKKAKLAAA